MAEHSNSYEEECQRAELLGIAPPNKDEFERQRNARVEQQLAEQEAAEANLLEEQDESLRNTGGKLDELNSILSSTQQRLNRFKQTACGSLTNIFTRAGSFSGATDAPAPAPAEPKPEPKAQPMAPPTAAQVSAAKAAQQAKMDGQLDKLDSLINKADNAQLAMSEQTKQMRRMAK